MTAPTSRCALPGTPLANASAGLDACVHCGFCLQACPTYVNLEDENDSPRGRLVLMRRLLDGDLAIDDPDVGRHMDRCLGCRACETACPSGVPYGELIEATRATMAPARGIPIIARLVLWLFAHRALLGLALIGARVVRGSRLPGLLARLLPDRLAFPFAMLASTTPISLARAAAAPARPRLDGTLAATRASAATAPAPAILTDSRSADPTSVSAAIAQAPRDPVTVLEGCVMRGLFSHVNAATARVLEANGYPVVTTTQQHCCGALHAHAGDLEGARALAKRNIEAFEQSAAALIAINSAGCGAMIKQYGHLLHDDAVWSARAARVAERARDVSELLAAAGPKRGNPLPLSVTHDPPCHQMHAQRVVKPPLAVLHAIPGLELVPLEDADQCCGSAGIYNLVEPETSDAVLRPKLERIAETGAAFVATGNPGCMMQIGAGLLQSQSRARVVHPIELLDASYRASAQ